MVAPYVPAGRIKLHSATRVLGYEAVACYCSMLKTSRWHFLGMAGVFMCAWITVSLGKAPILRTTRRHVYLAGCQRLVWIDTEWKIHA